MSKVVTPEEKAKELISKLMPSMYCFLGSGMLANLYDEGVALSNAKACAIICVDEILNVLTKDNPDYEKTTYWHPADYWQQVKECLK